MNPKNEAQMKAVRKVRQEVETLARQLRLDGAYPTSASQEDLAEAIRLLKRVEQAG